MRAVRVTSFDGPHAVELAEVPEPTGEGRVVIDVDAAGVIFPDVLQTRGQYQIKHEPPFTLGGEVAGIVRSAPEGARVKTGDRVLAFSLTGGFAETFAIDPGFVFAIPESLSFEKAVAIPVNYLTCHFALTRRGGLRAGETVLVHGAAGGVGTAACQLANALGARVIAVVSTPEKADVARAAGAHEVVLADGFLAAARELTGGRGVDVVLDPVGGDRFTDSLRSLREGGRLVVVGFTGGGIPEVKVNRLLLNNTEIVGAGWGAYVMAKPQVNREIGAALDPLVREGFVKPIVGERFPLEQAAEALKVIDERRATGKVVLDVR